MQKILPLFGVCLIPFLFTTYVASAATPVAWFKADAITGVSSGATLQTWTDASGNGFNATQSTASQRPTYVTNAMGGKPVVRFNTTNSTSLGLTRPVQDDFTIICVFQSTQGLNSGNLYYQGAGLVNAEVAGVVNDFGTCLFANGAICGGTGNPDVAVNSSVGYNDGKPHIFSLERVRTNGLVSLYVDGVLAGTTTGGTQSLTSPGQVVLGAQQTALYYLNGDIAEVQFYTNALSSTDRQTAEGSLVQKYNIVPSAPTGLYLQLSNGQPVLHWLATPGATSYYVERATTPGGSFTIIAFGSNTNFTDTTTLATNNYYYVVAALNAAGQSPNSVVVSTSALLNPHDNIGPSARTTPVVFSEIMYKPAARTDGNNVEFIELYNSNPWSQDISGYQITCADMNYTFPAGTTIGGGAYLVVAASPSGITSVYGITNVMGPYTGSLKKSETLQLLDEQGSVLLTVPYSNVYPWPVAADGAGHSIVLANPTYGEGDPRAWDISDTVGGSPGQADAFTPSPLRSVVINEILPHSENPAVPQFIELYNHSMVSNDVSGCILTDDPTTNKFVIPAGTVIPPAGFVSFTQFGFTLNGAGETLYFIKPDGSRILDAVQFGAQADGVSYGRWPDGANDFYAFTTNTPGTNNSSIQIGDIVINELMYDPISGNDDDQYIELYNKGTNTINLLGWQFTSGVTFTFPNISIAPNGYIVVGQNTTNLFSKYPNLNSGNTVGNYSGKLSHNGELVQLSQPETLNGTNAILVAEDQVTYGTGGRWGEWSSGGGSSLELIDPHANHRLAANWTDSNESAKSTWTNITFTGTLDNGFNYDSFVDYAQVGVLDVGEAMVDNFSITSSTNAANLVLNPGFASGTLSSWSEQGSFVRSSLDTPGDNSTYALHLRNSDRYYNGDDSCQMALAANTLASGQTATLSFAARWLHGWPEVCLRLNGGWLEATGWLPVPNNLGSPGAANSTVVTNAGPAIYNVTHFPSVPAANQPVVVTANVSDPNGLQSLTLFYRLDPATAYTAVPMNDGGTNGDTVPHDGVFSATIPGQAANQVVAFYISATDTLSASTRFPALRPQNNEPVRECVVMFGDGNGSTAGSFGVYHLWLTQTNATRWSNLGNLSNEGIDCTMVNGNRVIYNMQAHFAGSPVHQDFDTPTGAWCHYKWIFNDDDKFLGATDFNKIHWPGNTDNDPTIQREQCANTFLRALGVPWLNRRYVVVYVNGNRRGTLMEDAQTPDSDMVKQYFANDSDGWLYKVARWYEFGPFLSGYATPDALASEAMIMPYTTTGGVKKVGRYRWNFESRRTPTTVSDYTNVFSMIDAAGSQGTPNYVRNMEDMVNMENWMRVFAANHAAGNWDCFGSDSGQNLYAYIGAINTKWSLMMFDFNIGLGIDGSYAPGQSLFTTLSGDTNMAGIYNEPTFRRMYWRALQELCTTGPLNLTNIVPLLNDKFATFTANGLSVEDPNLNLIPWLTQASSGVLAQVNAANVTNLSANMSVVVSNNLAYITGVAPFDVATVLVNGFSYPLTWESVTNFMITVPLQSGVNQFNLTGVDRSGNTISNDTATVSVNYTNALPSPAGNIVINEIMYAPLVDGAQFIELYNNSTNTAFDLSGWQLSGLNYTFPNGSLIAPTNYLVLAANNADFAAAYGATNPVFDLFSGPLPTAGETLWLIQPAATNVIVAAVQYENTAPWPVNLNGRSLQLIDPHQDNWRAGNWLAAPATPDALNSVAVSLPPFPPLWLNEVEASNLTGITNKAGQRTPWLELYNPSATNVSLSGLYLANNYTNLTQWAFPTNANIAAGQFAVIFADGLTNLSTTNELHTGFTLTSGTGSLALTRLFNGQPQVLDYLDYNNLPVDQSYGDYPDGQSFIRQTFFYPTPGGTNDGSGVQPPSSILYNSAGMIYAQNFDSLPAPGATSVNADNPIVINGATYSLANPFDFAFPSSAAGSGGLGLSGLSGWYGYAALGSKFGATFGDQTTGGVLDFGGTNSSNRALGLIATSSTGGTAFGVKLINATGVNLNYLTVNFTGELWRQSDTAKVLQCYYTIDPSATNVWPATATALLPALNVTFATLKADKGGVAVDGTQSVNQTNLSVLNQTITTWPPGAALWLVWQMTDNTKLAQGLGLDNLNFSASVQPVTVLPPVSLQIEGNQVFLGSPTVSGGIYRIQYKNNLTDTNWTTLGADQTGNGNPLLLNLDATTNSQRFYRVLLVN